MPSERSLAFLVVFVVEVNVERVRSRASVKSHSSQKA